MARRRKKKVSQHDIIIRHLAKYGSITQLEALAKYSIMRLAARITELKNKGYNISSELIRMSDGAKYSRYKLEV